MDKLTEILKSIDFSKTARNKDELRQLLSDKFSASDTEVESDVRISNQESDAELAEDELYLAAGGLYQPPKEE